MKTFLGRFRRLLRTHRRLAAALLAGAAVWAGLSALRPADPPTVAVLVATRPLTGGVTIGAEDVAVRQLPVAWLPTEYLDDPVQAVGRPATLNTPAGAVLVPASVVSRDSLATPGMAVLPVALTATAAGLIKVGDHIDLIASTDDGAAPVASAARVVAVLSSDPAKSGLVPTLGDDPVVLVELRPDALAKVAAAAARGPLGFGFR
ncbi:SAF domain-containing protein [Micropruina sp.]|uniref:SAF domain-containing protein n=1 Tax=Micropruina sp. TaxID=2737536 RepID=UPI0039E43C33